jgi:hypothetical protein
MYEQLGAERIKRGPSRPLQDQLTQRMSQRREAFSQKSLLIAPPLLVQARADSGPCASDFSDEVVRRYLALSLAEQCSEPYECEGMKQSDVYDCPSDQLQTEPFFGIESSIRRGDPVYIEYLSAIADNSVLFRTSETGQKEPISVNKFVDSRTRTVELAALFYSVEFGITTDLRVTFDTTGGRVMGDFSIRHYVAVTGTTLNHYWLVQCVVIALLVVMGFDNVLSIKRLRAEMKDTGNWPRDKTFSAAVCVDFCVLMTNVLYLSQSIPDRLQSGAATERIIGATIGLTWREGDYTSKRSRFLELMDEVHDEIDQAQYLESVGMVITMLLVLRMVLATAAHPRIALVVGTLSHGFSDLFHLSLIFLLTLYGFAAIACWRYGAERDDLSTIGNSMLTFFDSMLDPPGLLPTSTESGDVNLSVQFFAVLFHCIFFFLMINFVLAIIVNAYMEVLKELDDCKVEQDILSDLVAVINEAVRHIWHRWPGLHKIMHKLEDDDMTDVEFLDVDTLSFKCAFRSEASAKAFHDYYSGFSFLTDSSTDTRDPGDQRREIVEVGDAVTLGMEKTKQLKKSMDSVHERLDRLNNLGMSQGLGSAVRGPVSSSPPPEVGPPAWAQELISEVRQYRKLVEGDGAKPAPQWVV